MKKRCLNKFLMAWGMAIGLLIPSSVSAQVNWNEPNSKDGSVWGHLISETQIFVSPSSSRVNYNDRNDSKKIFALWNVGAKKYLYQGGFWGTEAILSDNFTPIYLLSNGGNNIIMPNNVPAGNTYWNNAVDANNARYKLGIVDDQKTKDDNALYIDNTSNRSTPANANFTYSEIDPAKKIYAITKTFNTNRYLPIYDEEIKDGEYVLYNRRPLDSYNYQDLSINNTTKVEIATANSSNYGQRKPSLTATNWTFTKSGDTYTITNGDYYLYCNNSGSLARATNLNSVNGNGNWKYENGYLYTTIDNVKRYLNVNSLTTETEYYNVVRYPVAINLNGKTAYIDQIGGNASNPRRNVLTMKIVPDGGVQNIPATGQWKLISREDFYTAFDLATSSEAKPADATFFISNPGLCRLGADWTFGKNLTGAGAYNRIGDSYNYNKSTNASNGETSGGQVEGRTDITFTSRQENHYGNGYTVTIEDAKGGFTSQPAGTTNTYYQSLYGGYYNGRIYGTSGSIEQTLDVTKKGYYIIGVYAYLQGSGTATLSISGSANGTKGGIYSGSANVKKVTEGEPGYNYTMNEAGLMFSQMDETSPYYISAMVYIDGDANSVATEDLKIELKLEGGSSSTLEFDNFRAYYTGDAYPIILNENETSLDYLEGQVTNTTEKLARTLYLKRAINKGVWNSISLPVDVDGSKIRTAFGNDTRLCEYMKVDEKKRHIIWFQEIDIKTDGADGIKAGRNYIIFPINCTPDEDEKSEYVTYRNDDLTNKYSVKASKDSPVFTFNQINLPLKSVPSQNADAITNIKTSTDKEILEFCSTYYKGPFVTKNSYIIAGNNSSETEGSTGNYSAGNWYHWVGASNLTVKGFRCWLGATGENNDTYGQEIPTVDNETSEDENAPIGGEGEEDDPGAKLMFMIVDTEGEVTAIPMIKTENGSYEAATTPAAYNDNVYSVNGQLVGKGINALNNLAKGIYIVNGKKYVVK